MLNIRPTPSCANLCHSHSNFCHRVTYTRRTRTKTAVTCIDVCSQKSGVVVVVAGKNYLLLINFKMLSTYRKFAIFCRNSVENLQHKLRLKKRKFLLCWPTTTLVTLIRTWTKSALTWVLTFLAAFESPPNSDDDEPRIGLCSRETFGCFRLAAIASIWHWISSA